MTWKLIASRAFVIVFLPAAIVWSVSRRLSGEMRSMFRLTWLDIRAEVDSARRVWTEGVP